MANVNAFLFGLVLAIAIGPIALLIINVSLVSGIRKGLRCGLGAATADLLYALFVFMGGHAMAPWLHQHEVWLHRLGGVILVFLACRMLLRSLRTTTLAQDSREPLKRPYFSTLMLTLSNPLTIVAFSGLALQLPIGYSLLASASFAVSIFAGSAVSHGVLATVGGVLAHLLQQPRWRMAVNLLSGIGILLFGLAGLCAVGAQ